MSKDGGKEQNKVFLLGWDVGWCAFSAILSYVLTSQVLLCYLCSLTNLIDMLFADMIARIRFKI